MGAENSFYPDDAVIVAVAAVSRQRPGIDRHLDTVQAHPPPPNSPPPLPHPPPNYCFYAVYNVTDAGGA